MRQSLLVGNIIPHIILVNSLTLTLQLRGARCSAQLNAAQQTFPVFPMSLIVRVDTYNTILEITLNRVC